MALRFRGGERLQRGRGIGGLLRLARGLFKPLATAAKKAITSKTAKAAGKAITNQLVESGANIASDALMGNDINESFQRELVSGRQKSYIAQLVSRRQKAIAQSQRLKKYLNIKGEMELKENEKLLKKESGFNIEEFEWEYDNFAENTRNGWRYKQTKQEKKKKEGWYYLHDGR